MSDPHLPADARKAAALVALALAAVYHPLWAGRSLLSRDVGSWTAPARWLVREALARGRLPAWCPWEGIGFPVAADPLFATFYPPSLVTLPLPLAWGTSLYLFAHVALGAAGTFSLARRLGALPIAAAVGALAWALSGVTASEWDGGVRLLPAAWFPWAAAAAWSLVGAARAGTSVAGPALGLGVAGAMMALSGEVFVALMGAMAALTGAAAALLTDGPAWDASARRRLAVGGAGAGALAAALSAPSWLPAVALVGATPRGESFESASRVGWSLHPALLVDLAVSRATLDALVSRGDAAAAALLGGVQLYPAVYLGAAALALAALAPTRRARSPWLPFAALAALGLALALGRHLPAHAIFTAVARPFARMRSPAKFLLLTHFAVAALAALGADRALRGGAWTRRLGAVAVAVAAAVGVLVVAVPRELAPHVAVGAARALLTLGALALALRSMPTLGERAGLALAALVALDLGAFTVSVQQWEDGAAQTARAPLAARLRALPDASRRGPAPVRLWRSPAMDQVSVPDAGASVTAQRRALLRPKFNLDLGVGVLPGYEVAVSGDVDRLARAGRAAPLRLLSIDHALTRSSAPPGMRLVEEVAPGARLFSVDAPLPRAFVAHAAVADAAPDRLSHLVEEPVLTGALVTLAAAELARVPRRTPAPPSPCAVVGYAPGEVSLRCEAAADGVAVWVEQWASGWRASVDGRDAPVLRVDRVMLGVPVRAGVRAVSLRYETPRMGAALGLAALGSAAAAAAWWRARRASVST
ncbi:MAG: hypothetical protein U0324_14985 [Polyangiales bacterium]